jgi:hypothetical protein
VDFVDPAVEGSCTVNKPGPFLSKVPVSHFGTPDPSGVSFLGVITSSGESKNKSATAVDPILFVSASELTSGCVVANLTTFLREFVLVVRNESVKAQNAKSVNAAGNMIEETPTFRTARGFQ